MHRPCSQNGSNFGTLTFIIFGLLLGHTAISQANKKVSDHSFQLSESFISSAVKKYIVQTEGCEAWQVQVSLRLHRELPKSIGKDSVIVRSKKLHAFYGHNIFTISYRSADGDRHSFTINCDIKRFGIVFIVTRRLGRHHIITGDEIISRKSELASPSNNYCEDINTVIGKRTKRIISAGKILKNSMLEEVPVVKRGDVVTALLYKKNLTISFPAKANQPGQIGDVISLRDMLNNKMIKAEVIDHGSVIVEK